LGFKRNRHPRPLAVAMDLDKLKSFRFPPTVQRYTAKDSILYALGLGFGDSPADPMHLQFVYENGLKAVPSACMVLAHPGFWISTPSLQIDWINLVHGEQSFELLQTLPPEGSVRGEYEIIAVEDKGRNKGAHLHLVKRLFDLTTGAPIALIKSGYLLRGDGGQGGFGVVPQSPAPLPDESPDVTVDIRTLPQSALIYRLSGDENPIHADPAVAIRAGFPQPILHGLCSMGIATRGLIETLAEGDPGKIRGVSVRFSEPVIPGETLRVEIFTRSTEIRFRARSMERGILVLDRGCARLDPT
jgi:acyl dehydratase